jgi:charged multivesicular body protein 6
MGNKPSGNKAPSNRKAEQKPSDKDEAVLELKISRDKLKRYRKRLEIESGKLEGQARELIRRNQRARALLVLKLRKHKEQAVDSTDASLLSVMKMIEDVEWASISVDVMKALEVGTNALKMIHQEMSIDDVEVLLEETQDAIEVNSFRLSSPQDRLLFERGCLIDVCQHRSRLK